MSFPVIFMRLGREAIVIRGELRVGGALEYTTTAQTGKRIKHASLTDKSACH